MQQEERGPIVRFAVDVELPPGVLTPAYLQDVLIQLVGASFRLEWDTWVSLLSVHVEPDQQVHWRLDELLPTGEGQGYDHDGHVQAQQGDQEHVALRSAGGWGG